jgi:hypothetical protein
LIAFITNARQGEEKKTNSLLHVFRRLGGPCAVIKPDPIPNSVVKRRSANGTMA